ncbi:MAG: outer membrane lipoprotein-sorting protein [Thermodesulfobacteriota bacterium]|nr:outer membrane lipoprotein-sorting protein [Thermodesulfobacteriota bacterium]
MDRYQSIVTVAAVIFVSLFMFTPPSHGTDITENNIISKGNSVLKDNSLSENGAVIVKKAFDYYRGAASVSVIEMTIHRPDWERTMKIKAWTRGADDSLFKITAPSKDRGNGTLKKGEDMWTFNPKVNRVIKLPPSMMSQAWMGSDFSNNDLAKSDTIVRDYSHTITDVKKNNGLKIYYVESIPHPEAPVVWGMLKFEIREDGIMIRQGFYDEDKLLVKELVATDIKMMGDRLFPCFWKIAKAEYPDEYTAIRYFELDFKDFLPPSIFTKAGLKKKIR